MQHAITTVSDAKRSRILVFSFLAYVAFCMLIFWGAQPVYSVSNRFWACVLGGVSVLPLISFSLRGRGVPIIELALSSYLIWFCLPLLYEDDHAVYATVLRPDNAMVDTVLITTTIAVIAAVCGHTLAKGVIGTSREGKVKFEASDWALAAFAISIVTTSFAIRALAGVIPMSIARIVDVVFSPDLGIAILSVLYYTKRLTPAQVACTLPLIGALTLLGVVSGMSQSALQPLFIWFLCRWVVLKNIPMLTAAFFVAVLFLMQPVKHEYRERVWRGQSADATALTKLKIYQEIAIDYWLDPRNWQAKDMTSELQESAKRRFSLLLFTQRYMQLTPNPVDFKNGESIKYLAVCWIPRFIWPDKPYAQHANMEYPLEYGIQHPKTTATTRFGVGHVAEAYVNFGFIGVPIVFFVLGIFYHLPKAFIGYSEVGAAEIGIHAAVAINLFFVGSTIGNAFGGVFTQVVCQSVILFWLGTVEKGKTAELAR